MGNMPPRELITKLGHSSRSQHRAAEVGVLSEDAFDALYLSPPRNVPDSLKEPKFGNVTPAALIGFVVSATPYAAVCMGWRGAAGAGGAIIPNMVFFGGVLQILGAVGEWILGNTFSMCLFCTYGMFWIVAGTQFMPGFGVGVQFSYQDNQLQGSVGPGYSATVGFYNLSLTMLTAIFTVAALRVNVVLFTALLALIFSYALTTAACWCTAVDDPSMAEKLTMISGGFTWAAAMLVWYLLSGQILASVDFPLRLPVGDLTTWKRGKSGEGPDNEHAARVGT